MFSKMYNYSFTYSINCNIHWRKRIQRLCRTFKYTASRSRYRNRCFRVCRLLRSYEDQHSRIGYRLDLQTCASRSRSWFCIEHQGQKARYEVRCDLPRSSDTSLDNPLYRRRLPSTYTLKTKRVGFNRLFFYV